MKSSLSLRIYLLLSGTIFFLVGFLHLLRLLYRWPVDVDGYQMPFLLSYVGFPVATGYAGWAVYLFRSSRSAGR
ncbi:MAG TPA: hypothetical protein PLB02_13085 [Thermoanaerobaculia bacterium]|nr:hypothetical protein [Thermoanaerobaculia bacterium]HQR68316.1 hypothetical protein [Thermoanaerobaculia bacterium]